MKDTSTTLAFILPIEFFYNDSEILALRSRILRKTEIGKDELNLLAEINDYCNKTI